MSLLTDLQARWQQTPKREQRLLLAAGAVLALALLWWVAVAPAWRLLKAAPQQHVALDAQLHQMQSLQAQAQALRAQPVITASVARSALDGAMKPMGAGGQMVVQAQRVTVTLKGVSPQALAQWLAAARQNARMAPLEAHLTRTPSGGWDGTLVLQLPAL
jgi:general secretion pathway protein M